MKTVLIGPLVLELWLFESKCPSPFTFDNALNTIGFYEKVIFENHFEIGAMRIALLMTLAFRNG